MWGWTTPKDVCHQILDFFYESGYRKVDAATNYPINKMANDFRKGEQILQEWILAHQIKDLEVCMKVGSLNNMKSPEHNLSASFLLFNREQYRQMLGSNLACFMIHWDNRNDSIAIQETLQTLASIQREGLRIGFSGLAHPEIYQAHWADYLLESPWLQLKHNLLYSDRPRYGQLADECTTFAYGLNAGGLKLSSEQYIASSALVVRSGQENPDRPPVIDGLLALRQKWQSLPEAPALNEFYQAALLFGVKSPGIDGLILGGSSKAQLQQNLHTISRIRQVSDHPWFSDLLALHRTYAPSHRSI